MLFCVHTTHYVCNVHTCIDRRVCIHIRMCIAHSRHYTLFTVQCTVYTLYYTASIWVLLSPLWFNVCARICVCVCAKCILWEPRTSCFRTYPANTILNIISSISLFELFVVVDVVGLFRFFFCVCVCRMRRACRSQIFIKPMENAISSIVHRTLFAAAGDEIF